MSRDLAFVIVNVIVFVVAYYFGRMLGMADSVRDARDSRARDYGQRSIGREQVMRALAQAKAENNPALFSEEMERIRAEELEDV